MCAAFKNIQANVCPHEGGYATFRARSIIRLFNDSISYHDSSACYVAAQFRRGLSLADNREKVNLVGNPIDKNSVLRFSESSKSQTVLQVYSILNDLVLCEIIPDGTNIYNIDNLLLLQNGFYLYRVTDVAGNQIGTGKFIVMH